MKYRDEEFYISGHARFLAQRVAAFLEELERQGKTPDGWESDQLAQLLAHLEARHLAIGADALSRLENPLPWRTPRALLLSADSPRVTIAECRASLMRIIGRSALGAP